MEAGPLSANAKKLIRLHGRDIIHSQNMQLTRNYIQHGNTSVFKHCLRVTMLSLMLARRLGVEVDERALVRGALLHDYFLYDWHAKDNGHKLHGFTHAQTALDNAERDFELTETERSIIRTHMFPLNIAPPKCREALIVCIADKLCAIGELRFF